MEHSAQPSSSANVPSESLPPAFPPVTGSGSDDGPREPEPGGGNQDLSDLELLKLAQTLREYHHKAHWEEEKHFTWLNSLVLSGELLVFASDKLSICSKSTLICILTGFGILVSLLALKVVRSESRNFQRALVNYISFHNKVFVASQHQVPTAEANRSYVELVGLSLLGRQNIRDAFQGVFLLFIVAFALIAGAFGAVNHLQWALCW